MINMKFEMMENEEGSILITPESGRHSSTACQFKNTLNFVHCIVIIRI